MISSFVRRGHSSLLPALTSSLSSSSLLKRGVHAEVDGGENVVMSGIQASGKIHVGNYLGAIRHWLDMQNDPSINQRYYSIVDLHSLTSAGPPSTKEETVYEQTIRMAATLIGCGIDPSLSSLFPQSLVPQHCELLWLLSCVTKNSLLFNMIQYKEKKETKGASLGLLSYPVLMTADILLYRATHVPVGEDQRQHLELARELAEVMNTRYTPSSSLFPIPQSTFFSSPPPSSSPTPSSPSSPPPSPPSTYPRVYSLRDGTKKMSKSDKSQKGILYLEDTSDKISKKIRKAKTGDVSEEGHFLFSENLEEATPEVQNLVKLFGCFSGQSPDQIINTYMPKTVLDFKKDLAEVVISELTPIRETTQSLMRDDRNEIELLLKKGAGEARERAEETMERVRKEMGMMAH